MAGSSTEINVLTNNNCPNSRAFNCPLLAARNFFKGFGFSLKFFFEKTQKAFDCDILFINSKVFRYDWQKDKGEIFRFLEEARVKKIKTVWFDTTDSTWCTQFEVLPYVDLFLKNQILKDKNQYLNPFRTGRIFTDFFNELYACEEEEVSYPVPNEKELYKLDISWNTCFENYNQSRYGHIARLKQYLRPFTANIFPEKLDIKFTSPVAERPVDISCRVGMGHSRNSVIAHRKAVTEMLKKMNVMSGKIPLDSYFLELCESKIGIGPFGVGEITLRDFEIMICGATLVKPEMEHMATWPELFIPDETFIPHKWDLSDLEERIESLMKNPEYRKEIALKAQNLYKKAVSSEGMNLFAERLTEKIIGQ